MENGDGVEHAEVQGVITDERGRPVEGAEVLVFWQRLRHRVELGQGRSHDDGRYHVRYRVPDDAPQPILLVLEARGAGLHEPVFSLPTRATPGLVLDLAAPLADPSQYGALLRALSPLLGHVPLTELVETAVHGDISFLATETGYGNEQVMQAAVAARAAHVTSLPPEAIYAFLKANVPSSLPSSLLDSSEQFTQIDQLVDKVVGLIAGLEPDMQTSTLDAAVKNGVVPPPADDDGIADVAARLQTLRQQQVLSSPYLAGKASLGELFVEASLPQDKHAALAAAMAANQQPLKLFWEQLAEGGQFTAQEVTEVRQTLAVGAFVKNSLPLVRVVRQRLTDGSITSLPALASLSVDDWQQLIATGGPGSVPANLVAEDPAATFAREIFDRVTAAYPTVALAARIASFVPREDEAAVSTFFGTNADLDLRRENVDAYLAKEGEAAFAGIGADQRPAVLGHVRAMQRVLRIVPHVDIGEQLLSAGLDSAAAITMTGKEQFVGQLIQAGASSLDAHKTYALARARYAGVLSMYSRFNRQINALWPNALGDPAAGQDEIDKVLAQNPTLSVLFGSQDYCEVDGCISVLSPTAYLTDLLMWLSRRTAGVTGHPNALAALLERRPDLGNLLLNCPNTNTALPYIDVVNELLADTIAAPNPAMWRQTTLSAAELRAAPDPANLNAAADTAVLGAVYPHTLPYDAPLDLLRTALAASKVPLWQVRDAFLPLHGAASVAQLAAVAAERLGTSAAEQTLITTPNARSKQDVWAAQDPPNDLAEADKFLAATGLSYEQLLELIEVAWVRGGGAPMTIQGADDSCDTSTQKLTPLDDDRMDLIHRFLRAWRRTGWQMWELDMVLSHPTLGDPAMTPQTLANLGAIARLQDATNLTIEQLLAFYGPINTTTRRASDGTPTTPLYDTLFRSPVVQQDPALAAGSLNGALDLGNHAPAIQAALQLDATDVTELINLTDQHRTLDNISLTYRVAMLARSLGLSLADLEILGPQPVTGAFADPAATLALIERAGALAAVGLSPAELSYVVTPGEISGVGITDDQVSAVVSDVTATLKKVHDSVYGSQDALFTVLGRQLPQLPPSADPAHPGLSDPAQAKLALAIVDGSFGQGDPARVAFINQQFAPFMTAGEVAAAVAALILLPHPATGAALDTRAEVVLTPLVRYLARVRAVAAVSGDLSLAPDVTVYLTATLQVPGAGEVALAALSDGQLLDRPVPGAVLSAAQTAVRVIHKVGTVVARLHLQVTELQWLVAHHADYGGLDLANMPTITGQPAQSVDQTLATVVLVQLQRSFIALGGSTATPPPAIASLMDLIGAVAAGTVASDADAQVALAKIAGATAADVTALATAIGMSLAAGDWSAPAGYDRLRRLLAIAGATGASGAAVASWGVQQADESAPAQAAVLALKSRYGADTWLASAQKLNDPLRQRRRDAYVAYLTGQRGSGFTPKPWGTDSNGLFDYFLIDTEMSSCMDTSRVVQAYCTVQLFVERALMNLEHNVQANADVDSGWSEWPWRDRYRVWQANREIFLWPENWMVETTRRGSSEVFDKLVQATRQTPATADELESVVLDYIDGLDQISHLHVTGMCQDPVSGNTHLVARSDADPPRFYHRTFDGSSWTPWAEIKLLIKAHHVVPAVHRRSLYLFWTEVGLANEPQQSIPAGEQTPARKSRPATKHAELSVGFSFWRNGKWAPAQHSAGKFYDVPLLLVDPKSRATTSAIEQLYTVKVNLPASTNRSDIYVDIHRNGTRNPWIIGLIGVALESSEFDDTLRGSYPEDAAPHVGRAVFDGRFNRLQLRDTPVLIGGQGVGSDFDRPLLTYVHTVYGADAERLVDLDDPEANDDVKGDSGLQPKGGALVTPGIAPGKSLTLPLNFTNSLGALQQNPGPLLQAAQAPFRVIGPSTDIQFQATNDFVYRDDKRSYYVQAGHWYEYGSLWRPVVPSNPGDTPYELRYTFLRLYHPYTKLFWHEVFNGGIAGLYNPALQSGPAQVDPSAGDRFSFMVTYQPVPGRVSWGEDGEIIDFSRSAAFSSYNWELFFHVPLYVAQSLALNQQFDDALKWLGYVFNPTAGGPLPAPQRYWVTAPFAAMSTAVAKQQAIENILGLVHENNQDEITALTNWEANPFDPFAVATMRPVAYMKAAVMATVQTLITHAEALFATGSRENLNQAQLLLVRASEIMGPQPEAVPPPTPVDQSFNDLQKTGLDDFANAMAMIENVLPSGIGPAAGAAPLPSPETFYFKIPPNEQLLGLWTRIDQRLSQLRNCLGPGGQPMSLALFDAPLDPGLLVAAGAAGLDPLSGILGGGSPLPNYRYEVLYAQAQKFTATARGFGAQLLAAHEKQDADGLALLLAQLQHTLLSGQSDLYQAQIDEVDAQIQALLDAQALQQGRQQFYSSRPYMNAGETTSVVIQGTMTDVAAGAAIGYMIAGVMAGFPDFAAGAAGFGGSPSADVREGGSHMSRAAKMGVEAMKLTIQALDRGAKLAKQLGDYDQRQDKWQQEATEAQQTIEKINSELNAARARRVARQAQQTAWEGQVANLQQQIDYLTNKFTNDELYDWMASTLATQYRSVYNLAYAMAKRAERCYQYELGLPSASFIQFGYWNNLYKGLLAGEGLENDLLRMHSSYLDLNARRYEISRVYSLNKLKAGALNQLITTGACDFSIGETVFDADYPGHYQRQLKRVSVTVVYPSPGKSDNVSCTLTLVANKVRMNTNLNPGAHPYDEVPNDSRFIYQYSAGGRIVLSQAQDDPGLFENQIHYQISDPRYLPFEGAGAISDWHLELPAHNGIDVTKVTDLQIHVLFTTLDGGPDFKAAVP